MAITVIDNVVQGTQEWLDLRAGRVTCSNALLLLEKGVNACIAANNDAANRVTPNGNIYAERGHVLEADIRKKFNEKLEPSGLELLEVGMIINDKYPIAGYSPDGLVVKSGDFRTKYEAIIEIKAYNDIVIRGGKEVYVGKHAKACESYDNVPLNARAQIQMELLISEAPVCYLILTNPDAADGVPKTFVHTVYPDEQIQSRLIEKLSRANMNK
ncbi:MAG: YqaJ viral recombinase family protein [Acutalibacteraceae bacterium]|nr:YqaJ viral recombinase family protein [Acutalibacteraceae bacterium]